MLVQDDVEPIDDFMLYVWRMIEEKPEHIISLFCSKNKDVGQALKAKTSWLVYDTICWGQSVIMPRHYVREFISWCDMYTKGEWVMDDTRVALWAALTGKQVHCPAPPPLQHAGELLSTWAQRDGTKIVSDFVGPWTPGGGDFRPEQRTIESFVRGRSRWLKES